MIEARAHNASSVVPHWSITRDIRVAADIAGANFKGDHRFKGEFDDIEGFEIYGQAVGLPSSSGHSNYGVFTDENGNTIIIAQESSERWAALKSKGIAGRNPIQFNIPRLFGDGHGEVDALTIAGIDREVEGRTSWKDTEDLFASEPNYSSAVRINFPERYNNVPRLLEALEKTGKKYDAVILVLLSGSPITFSDIVKPFAKLIVGAAGSVLSLVGIPPSVVSLLVNLVDSAFNGDPIKLENLIAVAQIITPAPLRQYVTSATSLVTNIQSGNYREAAKVIGLDLTSEVQSLIGNLSKGDLISVVLKSATEYTPLIGTITNALHADVMHKFMSNVTTKSISNAISDAGSVIDVTHMQHLFATLSDPTTIAAIPGAADVVETILKTTSDVTSPEIRRGLANVMNGFAVGTDTFDELLLRSLKSSANNLAAQGKELVMPLSIPIQKRVSLAREISNDVGVQVIIDDVTRVGHYEGFM